ncbi:MAG: hypothetical protein QXO76_05770 [Thermoproteota archaeon]
MARGLASSKIRMTLFLSRSIPFLSACILARLKRFKVWDTEIILIESTERAK